MTNPHVPDPLTERQLRFRVRQLVARFRFAAQDFEDLVQDARLRLLEAMPNYTPGRASRRHFARVILDYWAMDRARKLWKARMIAACQRVLAEGDARVHDIPLLEVKEEVAAFRAYVAGIAASLLPVLDLIGTHRPGEIGRVLGIDRVTTHRRVRRLQSLGRLYLRERGLL